MDKFYNSYRIAVPRKMHGPVQDAPASRERPGASFSAIYSFKRQAIIRWPTYGILKYGSIVGLGVPSSSFSKNPDEQQCQWINFTGP